MRGRESSRLFYILEVIKRNPSVNRAEIDAKLQRKAAQFQRTVEKGRSSVVAIIEALKEHPAIHSLSETEPYGTQDLSGQDIQVTFHADNSIFHKLGPVWIQSKSSQSGVHDFLAQRSQEYVLEHKIVVLIGTDRPEQIIASFEEQLLKIVYYHRFS